MHRRCFLGALVAGSAAAGGCLGVERRAPATTTDAPTTQSTATVDPSAHDVTVTRRVAHGATGVTRELRATDGGQLAVDLTCQDGTTRTATADAPDDEWAAFERQVVAADVTRFASTYECEDGCPSDAPPTRLTFDVDGTVTTVLVEATADQPEALAAIRETLDGLAEYVDTPSCV
mgnify:CR=1 FL=1